MRDKEQHELALKAVTTLRLEKQALEAMRDCHEKLHRYVTALHAQHERTEQELVDLKEENRAMDRRRNKRWRH